MTHTDHVRLIRNAISKKAGVWADLGSGTGAFTLALSDLNPQAKIYSVDKDESSLQNQEEAFSRMFPKANIQFITQDFTYEVDFPPLDGILMANSLHYVKDKAALLTKLKKYLKPNGRLVLVEYNVDHGNQWVPYPLSYQTFANLVLDTGFKNPKLIATTPSNFLNEIYSALAFS